MAAPTWAAKSAGSIVVLDDAFTAAASTRASGGDFAVTGALAPLATPRLASIRGETVQGGFFAFPFPFARLLLLAPGEVPVDGASPGKAGAPEARVLGSTFSLTVLATDWFFQPVADHPPQTVALSTTAGPAAQLPPAQTLTAGSTTFAALRVSAATGTVVVSAVDLTSAAVSSSESALAIVAPASSSPTVHSDIASGAVYATLGGGISGTASDPTGVQRVQLAVRRLESGLYYDAPARAFSLAAPAFSDAALGRRAAESTTWFFSLPDADLVDGGRYEASVVGENPSGLRVPAVSTFTFDSRGIAFSPGDGAASATALPATAPGCEALNATVTVTLQGSGVLPGGALAVRLPGGWSRPSRVVAAGALAVPGDVAIVSTAAPFAVPGSTVVTLNPATRGEAPLGDGWILVEVATSAAAGIMPGQEVAFGLRARPALGPQGRGPQRFEARTQTSSTGTLAAIAAAPVVTLTTGTATFLSFRDASAAALGALQTSPTMQIETVDACGNPAAPPAALTVTLQAGSIDASGAFVLDAGAGFFAEQTGAGITERLIFPPEFRPFEPGGFYYRTTTAGPRAQYVRLGGGLIVGEAYRFVSLRASRVAVSSPSIDGGTLSPGTTSLALAPGGSAVARFSVADPEVAWDLRIATGPGGAPPLFAAAGFGAPAQQAVAWSGVDARSDPPRAAAPGRYGVFIRAGGGTAEDASLEVRVPATAFVFGRLGAAGAGARISVDGPGAAAGRFAVASSTGYFEVYGLASGERYAVRASTRVPVFGAAVELSTSAAGVVASGAGGEALGLGFGAPSGFRVSVSLPSPAPAELIGRAWAHSPDFGTQAFGSLHFSSGAAASDSGGHAFGVAAATWTVLGLPPGRYDVEVEVPAVGISTVVAGRALASGQFEDLRLFFARKPDVHGFVVIPATKPFGSWVSVQASRGAAAAPSAFGGAFVPGDPAPRSSASWSLFGLDPGTWTVTARSPGFVSTSVVVAVSTAGIGRPGSLASGLELRLGLGGVVLGSVTVLGDTRGLAGSCRSPQPGLCESAGFVLFVQAYDPRELTAVSIPLKLSTSAASASAAFALSGLSSGPKLLRAFLPGFQLSPPGGVSLLLSTPSAAAASLTLRPNDGRLRLEASLPPLPAGVCYATSAFQGLGFYMDLRPDAKPMAGADITALAPTALGPALRTDTASGLTEELHCSSLTLTSPPLGPGVKRVWAVSASSGAAFLALPLVQGATTVFAADLAAEVHVVTGEVAVAGALALSRADGSAVSVSSAPGLVAQAASAQYCLLRSTAPVRLSAARVELVPVSADGTEPGPLLTAQAAGGDCRAFSVPGGLLANGLPDPTYRPPALLAYPGTLRPDGSFRIEGVPGGTYVLRNAPDLDLDASNGLEAAEFRRLVRVSASGTLGTVPLEAGRSIRGRVLAPEGTRLSRPARVALAPVEAGLAREAAVVFADSASAEFSFARLASGRYWLSVSDGAFPRAYVAAPRLIELSGSDVEGADLRLLAAGRITARLAVETALQDGRREQVLVSASNPELLPAGLRAFAVANPAFPGGFFAARGRNCGAGEGESCRDLALDSEGRLLIDGVLPGTYDLELASPKGEEAAALGGTALAGRLVAGVSVGEGETVDLGVLRIVASAVLSGRVLDAATGLAVPNVRVRAAPSAARPGDRSRRRERPETFTGSDGRYALAGLDPEVRYYDVTAGARARSGPGEDAPAYQPRLASGVDLRSTTTLDFSVLPAPFALSGRVVSASSEPLRVATAEGEEAGALLTLLRSGEVASENALGEVEALSAPDGRFRVPSLASGTYRVSVYASGLAPLERSIVLSTASLDLGELRPAGGAQLTGRILKPDGAAPGEDEVEAVFAVTSDLTEFLPGGLIRDERQRSTAGYRLSGFKPGRSYRLLLVTSRGERDSPAEASALVFSSTAEARSLDVVFRPPGPRVHASAKREGAAFRVRFELSQPLRARTSADDDLAALVSTLSARGALSERALSYDRGSLTALYSPGQVSPGVLESSFTLRLLGRSAVKDPSSAERAEPEYVVQATSTFHLGVDTSRRVGVNNFQGAVVALEGDSGRVLVPKGAFAVDASSTVELTLRRSLEAVAPSGRRSAAANLASLRFGPSAYPPSLAAALAATPPSVTPYGPFYDASLPTGLRLAKPVELCVAYNAGADPERLNLYWYNEAANAYVLQQDVRGVAPRIDSASRTRCQHIDHFSAFVLFDTGVSVITGSAFAGTALEAYAFPNPFDLKVKLVTPAHGVAAQSVRGTMLRVGVPTDANGDGRIRLYDVSGTMVRTLELGSLSGGAYYYQPWDGRDDSGRDVASGVYVGEVEIGGRRGFFKLAVIK